MTSSIFDRKLNFALALMSVALIYLKSAEAQGVVPYIVGGSPSIPANTRFLVSIHNNNVFLCAGTLVSGRDVVTSANCVQGIPKESLRVRGGTVFRATGGLVRNVINVEPFKNPTTADIAVLRLSGNFNGTAGSLNLCATTLDTTKRVRVTGFGRTTVNNNTLANQAQQAIFPLISNAACKQKVPDLPNSRACVGTTVAKNVCPRDIGGPVTINNQLCGVILTGTCNVPQTNMPGVFAQIGGPAKQFIRTQISRNITA